MTVRGRPRKGEDRLSHKVEIRLTQEQFETYKAEGGPRCLRLYLTRLKVGRVLMKPTPTAHQPFPTGPDRFTQNQCRITYDEHPGDKGSPSGY